VQNLSVDKRRVGRSGIEVHPIGLGCWAIGGPFWRTDGESREPMGWGGVDDAESIRAIHRALDLGVGLFDTANNYGAGHSEEVLGRALAGRRDGVVIATKFGSIFDENTKTHFDNRELPMTVEAIRAACEASLRRLQTDYIDIYLLHNGQLEPEIAAETVDVLEELVRSGLIRWYGWSTDDPERARVFGAGEHCTAIEHRMSLSLDTPEMLAVCSELDLASIVRSPLNAGVLTGKFTASSTFPPDDGRHDIDFTEGTGALRLNQIEQVRGQIAGDRRSMAEAALAWILTRSDRTIPIPGFKTAAQVEELVNASRHAPLDDDDLAAIEHAFRPG
jgi:aryl-alcohol dehydrogenase-like predicted oxidoreductase